MWIFTRHGFISAVQKNPEEPVISVRARTKKHLDQILTFAFGKNRGGYKKVITTPVADYRFRVEMHVDDFNLLTERLVDDVTYDNFKGSVKDDPAYLHALHAIWSEMHALQTAAVRPKGKKPATYRDILGEADDHLERFFSQMPFDDYGPIIDTPVGKRHKKRKLLDLDNL